ncbi:MAG: HNH endonuclease [Ktedonobacteraceae bacterium]|nr:HNH endonuclease [Ktedonobacteraceae bacterium]
METDHIIPLSIGGEDTWSNKWVLHRHCHDVKTAQWRAAVSKATTIKRRAV